MRRIGGLRVLAAAVLAGVSMTMSGAIAGPDPIRIGVLTVRSGPSKPIGDDILAGIETVVRQRGKLLGRPIELVVEESLFNAQTAVTKATKLVQQDNVAAILGTSTVETLALLSVADRLGVPIVTSNSGSAAITRERCNRWVFRTNPEDLMSVVSLEALIAQTPRLHNAKWFTIGHDYPWARLVAGATKGVKAVQYAGEAFAPLDTSDWAPFIAQAKASGATVVIAPVTLGVPLLQFIQQANEFGLTKDAVLVSPIGLPDWLVDKLGEASTGVISAGSWAAWRTEEQWPVTRGFNEAHYQLHGRVAGMQSLQSASAATVLFDAIEKANATSPEAIVKALETVESETPVGPLKFQAGGREALAPLFLGPYEKLAAPKYGASYAQRPTAVPASLSLPKSAAEYGCRLDGTTAAAKQWRRRMAHELNFLFVNIVNGLVYGSFLLLTSLGLSLVFGLGRVVNFAHGAFYALGGYVLISVMRVGAGFWLALAVVPVVLTGIGLALEAGLIRRLRKRPEVDTLLATFGLSAMLVGGIEYLWGTSTTIVKPPLGFEGIVQVLSNDFPIYRFAAAGLSLLMAAGVLAIVQWTPLGLRIRAIADDAEMAEAIGVDRSRLLWQVFGYAAGLAGFAGALGAPIFAVHPEMGLSILIDSFLVVVLGGLGSLKGSTIGAAVVSVTKAVGGAYLADWSTALLFLIVASVLVARPTGIFATGRIA